MPATAEEITDLSPDDIETSERWDWGQETYSYGTAPDGRDVVVIESPGAGTEVFALPGAAAARAWMMRELAASMRAGEGPDDLTFCWPAAALHDPMAVPSGDFAAVRTHEGVTYTVTRYGESALVARCDDYGEAVINAAWAANRIAERIEEAAGSGGPDELAAIGVLHLRARAHQAIAAVYRRRAGEAVRVAKASGVVGREGRVTVVDLAEQQLGVSRGLVNKVLAGEDWA